MIFVRFQMKKSIEKTIFPYILLAAALLVCLLAMPVRAGAEEGEIGGTCGEGVHWSLSEQGILTIESDLESAAIDDYSWGFKTPWYQYCSEVKKIVLNVSCTLKIGDHAFEGLDQLEKVTISSGCDISSVGETAFGGCHKLTTVENAQNIRAIGVCAFQDCESLTTLDLSGLKGMIPQYAFGHCTGLTEIRIPETVTAIGIEAFFGCSKLGQVVFEGESQLVEIASEAFVGCESLNHVILPEGVTELKPSVFQGCSSLTDLSGLENITAIGDMALAYTGFTEFTFPEAIHTVPFGCFNGSEQLESVDLNQATVLEAECFSGCLSLKTIKHLENVKKIGEWSFGNCSSLKEFTFPERVKTAAAQVLTNCTGLETLNLNNVKKIEMYAFSNCQSLKQVTHNGYITSIGEGAFKDCPLLTEYRVSYGVTEIKPDTFSGCTNLTKVFIPNTVTEIDYDTFAGVHELAIFTDHTKKSAKGIFEDLDPLPGDSIKVYYNVSPEESPIGSFTRMATKITLKSKVVDFNNKIQKIGTAKIAGSSGKVTYTYYRNKACTKKTTVQKSGAKKKGGAPKYPGTYYVKVTVKKDSYFKGATANLVTLTIQPKVSFQWKEYQGYDFILPKISGLKWVKSYYVELYDKQNQLLRKSKKYTEPMKFGIRPGSGTKETDKYQAGKKYFVKVVFRMKNGGTITVAGRTLTR